jgi:T-complex protein 1 subunit epsilon
MAVARPRLRAPSPCPRLPTTCVSLPGLARCSLTPAQIASIEQYAVRAFASALDAIPLALAENSGLSPIDALAEVKSRQVNEGNPRLGIDCVDSGENGACERPCPELIAEPRAADMKTANVVDPLLSKRSQYLLATQLVRAVLKVCRCSTGDDSYQYARRSTM